jgi:hypothetical protein
VALHIYKYSTAVYDFLVAVTDKTVKMKCQFSVDHLSRTILFTAFDHRPFQVRLSARPDSYSKSTFVPDRFQIIEVVCNNDDEHGHTVEKYQDQSEILPHNLIKRLAIVAHQFTDVSMQADCIRTMFRHLAGRGLFFRFEHGIWKMTYTTN